LLTKPGPKLGDQKRGSGKGRSLEFYDQKRKRGKRILRERDKGIFN